MKVFQTADILLPKHIDMQKWSVIACDQFTSQSDYWEDVYNLVGADPSTLHIIFPEIYLEASDSQKRMIEINRKMKEYLDQDLFQSVYDSFVYVERTAPGKKTRRGLVGVVDLEKYSYEKGAKTPVRATEGTVLERIPPRMQIRENAVLEIPHIMLLIDDVKNEIMETAAWGAKKPVYDFELMKNGGRIKGYVISGTAKQKQFSFFHRRQ